MAKKKQPALKTGAGAECFALYVAKRGDDKYGQMEASICHGLAGLCDTAVLALVREQHLDGVNDSAATAVREALRQLDGGKPGELVELVDARGGEGRIVAVAVRLLGPDYAFRLTLSLEVSGTWGKSGE